ncbi:hypothetical protein ACLOJK_008240 [Asimina triloba]
MITSVGQTNWKLLDLRLPWPTNFSIDDCMLYPDGFEDYWISGRLSTLLDLIAMPTGRIADSSCWIWKLPISCRLARRDGLRRPVLKTMGQQEETVVEFMNGDDCRSICCDERSDLEKKAYDGE